MGALNNVQCPHLRSVRVMWDGNNAERSDYYPFGGRWTSVETQANTNRYLYNGKESQEAVGLSYLDYGARMYDSRIGRWHSIDPKAEKRYGIGAYHYCSNDPINRVDPDGEDDYYTINGDFLFRDDNCTDYIIIRQYDLFACLWNASSLSDFLGERPMFNDTLLMHMLLPASVYSKIFTNVLLREGFDLSLIKNGEVSVKTVDWGELKKISTYNDPYMAINHASWNTDGSRTLTATVFNNRFREFYGTVSNIINMLWDHEFTGHGVMGWDSDTFTHHKVYEYQMQQPSWENATEHYKQMVMYNYEDLLWKERRIKLKK